MSDGSTNKAKETSGNLEQIEKNTREAIENEGLDLQREQIRLLKAINLQLTKLSGSYIDPDEL